MNGRSTRKALFEVVRTKFLVRALSTSQRARPLAGRLARDGWRAAVRVGRSIRTHRVGLLRLLARVLWWGSLGLWIAAGNLLFGIGDEPAQNLAQQQAFRMFVAGGAFCALVLGVACERHVRALACALALGHGTLALVAWIALGG